MNALNRTRSVLLAFVVAAGVAMGQVPPDPQGSGGILWAATRNDVHAIDDLVRESHSVVESADSDGRTAMHYAASHGSCDAIRALYAHGASLDRRTSVSVTPLMWAFEFHQYQAFKLLISLGANLEIRRTDAQDVEPGSHDVQKSSMTVLDAASEASNPDECLTLLLAAGADPNAATAAAHWTPLMLSAKRGLHAGLVTDLVRHGARVNARSTVGRTALSYAVEFGSADYARALLANGASTAEQLGGTSQDWPSISYATDAVRGGNPECLRLVICYGASPIVRDAQGRDIAEIARVAGRADLTALVSEILVKVSSGYTAAHFAVLYGHAEALQGLKSRGYSVDEPDSNGNTPLMVAAASGDLASCDALVKLGADTGRRNTVGDSCLHMAVRQGSVPVVSLLMAAGASPTVKNDQGETPRGLAASEHNDLLNKMLSMEVAPQTPAARLKKAIETGDEAKALSIIDTETGVVSARYGKAWTPLLFAAYYRHPSVVKELALKGASLDARSDTGWTALMLAVQQKSDEVVKALLQLKVDVNERANTGRTALHVAAQENSASCATLLLQAGAKPDIKDSSGFTALALAQRLGNTAVVKALTAKAH